MASSPYAFVAWEPNEVISKSKMDQLSNNQQYLFDNMPRAHYSYHVRRSEGVKIACGYCYIPASTSSDSNQTVYFSEFFTPGCKPIVTTGLVSGHGRVHHTINGIGVFLPDHRGFEVHIRMDALFEKNNVISNNMYVGWQAMGY